MFVIKSKNKKYLVRDEDAATITFNLVASEGAATTFRTRTEAEDVVTEAYRNAEQEIKYLGTLDSHEAVALELDSLTSQFLTLSVTEIK